MQTLGGEGGDLCAFDTCDGPFSAVRELRAACSSSSSGPAPARACLSQCLCVQALKRQDLTMVSEVSKRPRGSCRRDSVRKWRIPKQTKVSSEVFFSRNAPSSFDVFFQMIVLCDVLSFDRHFLSFYPQLISVV